MNTTYTTHTNVTANVLHRMSRPKKIKEQMGINAATVALLLRTCCIRCSARKNEGANGNQLGNGRIVTRTCCTRSHRPKKMQKQIAINAATVALSPRTCSTRCPVPKNAAENCNQYPNGRTVTANVLHTMPRPKKRRSK